MEISYTTSCARIIKKYEPIKFYFNKIELNKETTFKLSSKTLLFVKCSIRINETIETLNKVNSNTNISLKTKDNSVSNNSSFSKEIIPKKRNSFLHSNSKVNILSSKLSKSNKLLTYLNINESGKLKVSNFKELENSIGNGIEKDFDSLENDNSYEILNGIDTDFPTRYETFAECIFISGLNSNKLSLIEKSNEYPSICNHEECSLLPSFNPEILYFYKKDKINFELSNLISKMNFPLGIKICFFNDEVYNKTKKIYKYDNYMNIIRNEKGDNFYMVSIFYYQSMSLDEYNKKYNINPLKKYIKFENEVDENGNEINQKDFNKNLKIVAELMNKESLLIPYCISIVSKYPYKSQMEKCLEEILNLHLNNKTNEIDELINHIINEIPIPSKNQKIMFYLPTISLPLELISPKNINSSNIYDIDLFKIVKFFDIDNIIFIFYLIITEQKLLFIHNNYNELTEISYGFINLIYPFNWINTYIPVLSFSTVQFLQSFIPYIMGIDEYLLTYAFKNQFIDLNSNIALINIKNNNFCSFDLKGKIKKRNKKEILKKFKLPEIPDKIVDYFEKKLKDIKKQIKNLNYDKITINKEIKDIFLKGMILIIGEYNHHLFFSHEETPIFDSQSFINTFPNKEKSFYSEIISTQLFHQFLFNEKLINLKEENNIELKENNIIDTSYFKKALNQYHHNLIETFSPKRKKSIPVRTYSLKKRNSISKIKELNGSKQRSRDSSFQMSASSIENNIFSDNNPYKKNNLKVLSKKNSLASINSIDNKKKSKIILIYPYFIKEKINKLDKSKISQIIIDNYNKDKIINLDKKFPLIIQNEIQFETIPKKHKIFFYHKRIKSNIPVPLSFPKTEQRYTSIKSFFQKQELTKIKSNEEIMNDINNWFTEISTSVNKNSFKIIDIKIYLKIKKYRTVLSKLLYQGSVLDDQNNKMISNFHFEEILDVIKYCLNLLKNDEFEICKLFTLSLFSYYKKENDKNIFLYEEYINPKRKIKQCKLWCNSEFWVKWYEEDINQKVSDIENDLNISENEDSNSDKIKIDLLDRLESVMKELKINKDLIKIIIVNELAHRYLNEENFIEFEQNFV